MVVSRLVGIVRKHGADVVIDRHDTASTCGESNRPIHFFLNQMLAKRGEKILRSTRKAEQRRVK